MELTVTRLNKTFGDNHVLKDVGFSAKSGSAFGLLGRNGAGKTTTIRIIMGVFPADSGEILIDGKAVDRSRVRFGYLPEERGLYQKIKIIDQLIYLGRLRGMTKADAITSADYWLDRLEMAEYKNRRLDTLSKGNQQKIQMAVTLLTDPDIVIFDEPFSGLDPVNSMLLKEIFIEVVQKGKLVLFSSHQMNYIEEFCDNMAILNAGRVVKSGSIRAIKRAYDRTKIVIESPDISRIREALREQTEETEGGLLVRLNHAEDKADLLLRLANAGFDIDEFRVHEPTLAEIFVEYTKN